MAQSDSPAVRRPRSDDRPFWDLVMGIYGSQAVLVAHDLKLFPLLARGPLSLEEIGAALKIPRRPAAAVAIACVARGLLREAGGRYGLTPLAEDYLLEGGPSYFGGFLDFTLANSAVLSFETIERAVLTDAPQVYGGEELYASHEQRTDRARAFTAMMHSHSAAAAQAWPGRVDLAGYRVLLDVGGGSGAHAMAAVRGWPDLRAIVLDLAPVCDAAQEFIGRAGLADRVATRVGEIWTEPYPDADVHLYADIFHDFTPERCRFLAAKSFASLPSGGRILVHEMLLNEAKSGPAAVAGYNVSMLLWTEGQQFSGGELADLLAGAGFAGVEVLSTFGYWGVVTGRKS